jgi:hypothetical protein
MGVTVSLQVLTISTGLIVASLLAPDELSSMGQSIPAIALWLGIGVLVPFALHAVPWVRHWLSKKIPKLHAHVPTLRGNTLVTSLVLCAVAWFGFGMFLVLLQRALFGVASISWTSGVGVFCASYVFGFVALFAPAGIGPREAALVLLLSASINAMEAAALALASRVMLTLCDIGFAIPFVRSWAKVKTQQEEPPGS